MSVHDEQRATVKAQQRTRPCSHAEPPSLAPGLVEGE
jgi:hypothetical protein